MNLPAALLLSALVGWAPIPQDGPRLPDAPSAGDAADGPPAGEPGGTTELRDSVLPDPRTPNAALPVPGVREGRGDDGETRRTAGPFTIRTFADGRGRHDYALFVPRGTPPAGGWPVILFLHGAYERGTDGVAPTTAGLGPAIAKNPADFPYVAVFPQVEDPDDRILTAWAPDRPAGRRALAILESVEAELKTNPDRRYLAGWSMGGYGVFAHAAADPDRWTAAVTVSGGGDPATAERFTDLPLWAVSGGRDALVPTKLTRRMVDALRAAGGDPGFTVLSEEGHTVWKRVFASDAFYRFLQDPSSLSRSPELPDDPSQTIEIPPLPFKPAVEIGRAGFVRLDAGLLERVVETLAADYLSEPRTGTLDDQTVDRSVAGLSFKVTFRGLRYSVRVNRVTLVPRDGNRLTLRVEFADARVDIGGVSLAAPLRHRATAGPTAVVAGARCVLPLEVDLRPRVVNRKVKLDVLAVRFRIPPGDYRVIPPRYVSENLVLLTDRGWANKLVEGLCEARGTLETQVRQFVPQLVTELEGQLGTGNPGGFAEGLSPVPLSDAQVRPFPESFRADAGGVTATFGLTVGASVPSEAPPTPGFVLAGLPDDAALAAAGRPGEVTVGISPAVVRPLSGAAVDPKASRVNVLDVPGAPLEEFTNRDDLAAALPAVADLPPDTELRGVLTPGGPVGLELGDDATGGGPADTEVVLTAEKLRVELSSRVGRRDDGENRFASLATLSYELRQPLRLSVLRGAGGERQVRARRSAPVELVATVEFPADSPLTSQRFDADAAERLLTIGWNRWLDDRGPLAGTVDDLALGPVRLRLEAFDAIRSALPGITPPPAPTGTRRFELTGMTTRNGGGAVLGRFDIPPARVVNRADVPLVYRTRRGKAAWSAPFTLPPDTMHTFGEPAAFEIRRDAADATTYTLNPGVTAVYKRPAGGGEPRLVRPAG